MISIKPIKALSDNYIWLVTTNEGSIVIDPGESKQIIDLIKSNEIDLEGILITHHHYDHTNGIEEILKYKKVEVFGPNNNVNSITKRVKQNDVFNLIGLKFEVIETPGHTLDHIAFYCCEDGKSILFCGDTLFSGGCGRVFEGTYSQMYESLKKLSKLPEDTQIFCGHEYTSSNLQFACAVEPNNQFIKKYSEEIIEKTKNGVPSLPSSLKIEYMINPFIRCNEENLIDNINKKFGEIGSESEIFSTLRKWKDDF
ncbi:MAG: hydroxyacylglutathione hydrolase [Pseudomonadota bacterium]|nr:hydroxyacylglutathione hydrolase [Pseudomonadota bacterium]